MSEAFKQEDIVARECRFVTHIKSNRPGSKDDIHLIKENLHLKDGSTVPNVTLVKNFKRPFWITTPANRNHEEKKEWEKKSRVKEHTSTQRNLAETVALKLHMMPNGNNRLSVLNRNPYVYGTDVSASTIIKHKYTERYPDTFSKYSVAALDFETDMSTAEELPIMGILSMKDKAHLTIHEKMVSHIDKPIAKFWEACSTMEVSDGRTVREHLEERGLWNKVQVDLVDDNLTCVTNLLASSHEWMPDLISIWNADFDVSKMMETFKYYGVDPAPYMTHPSVPVEYNFAEYKPGAAYKQKANGDQTPVPPVDRWNTLITGASWYVVCAMCSYKKLRPTEPKMKYSLDNAAKKHIRSIVEIYVQGETTPRLSRDKLLAKEYFKKKDFDAQNFKKPIKFPEDIKGDIVDKTGNVVLRESENSLICNRYGDKASSEVGKLKFAAADGYIGREWHVFMQKHYPIEYAVYCLWDGIVLEKLDEQTNDLSTTLPVLCGPTEFARFPSGPKKLCDNMHFFVQESNHVVGSTSDDMTTAHCKHLQSLNDWITLLEPHTVHDDIGLPVLKGFPNIKSKASVAAFDIDVKSAYPNTGDAANTSKATTRKEFCAIEHLDRMTQRQIGLNFTAPTTNAVELCRMIYRAPSLTQLMMKLQEQGKIQLNNPNFQ